MPPSSTQTRKGTLDIDKKSSKKRAGGGKKNRPQSAEQETKSAKQLLQKARSRHAKILKKVAKARAKVEKHTARLQAVEAEMATLARQTYQPETERLGQAADGDEQLKPARLIFNPNAGSNAANGEKQLDKIIRQLRSHGIRAEIGLKTSGKAVRELVKEVLDAGGDFIIAAGGDGTIEEVAAQLVGTKATLGIIPVGTRNNLARALGIPLDINGACELLGLNTTRKIDVGRVKADTHPEVEYFLETAGAGLSALSLPAGEAAQKGKWGALPSAIRKLFDSQPRPVQVELDNGQVITANSELVTISNSPLVGNNVMLAPDAKLDDGLLDIAVYDAMGKTELLSYFMGSSNGTRTYNPKIKFYRSKRVIVRSELANAAHSDMDLIEGSQQVMEIELVPQALQVVVGQGFALTLPVDVAPTPPPLAGNQPPAPDTTEAPPVEQPAPA